VKHDERLVMGMCTAGALMFCIGSKVDDALGHDGRSLTIGLVVALAVGVILSAIVVRSASTWRPMASTWKTCGSSRRRRCL
jgi:uncharacterized protein involved in response to NO